MAILWSDRYSIGIPEIDQQHQELFSRVDSLLEACNQGKGKEVVGEVITFLEEYVQVHFEAEEKLMREKAYPGYQAHALAHKQFIAGFSQIKEKFEKEGAGLYLVVLTNKKVVDWLKNHILKVDAKLGDFLREKREPL